MGGIRRRVERLEGRTHSRAEGRPDYLETYFRALKNHRRVDAGLDPLPYSDLDRREDERFLEETLPTYRAAPGWQRRAARATLDGMEEHVRERLRKE